MENANQVIAHISSNDLVLDVGGWACPFNRANWVLDAEPYETRGFYEKIGLPKSQGGEREYFSKDTWVQRDICDKKPWPFEDNFFDFSICSHTLEDIRDPLYVCSELIRVSKRGYIEVPSRIIESCRGAEGDRIAGLSHHRWLVEINDNHIQFTMKYHTIHSDFRLSFPASFGRKLSNEERISYLFWEDNFTFAETKIDGAANVNEYLREFIAQKYQYPDYKIWMHSINGQINRAFKGIQRRVSK